MGRKASVNGARLIGRQLLIAVLMGTTSVTAAAVVLRGEAQAQELREIRFSIPAGSLSGALATFGRQAGLQVTFLPEIAAGKRTAGVSGSIAPETALNRLLQGSGLSYAFIGSNTVTVTAPGAGATNVPAADGSILLDPILVRSGAVAPEDAPYTTPGSSAYISRENLDRFGGSSPGDIFRGTPGVMASGIRNGAKLDVNIRGQQGQGRVKVAIDGTQQSTTTWRGYRGVDERVYIDPDMIGGVDIEKGPTSGANGAGAPGGVVSIHTLLPEDILRDGKNFGARVKVGTSDNAVAPPPPITVDQRTDRSDFFDFENGSASAAVAGSTERFDFVFSAARRKTGNYFAGKDGDATYSYRGFDRDLSFTKPGEEVFNTSQDTFSVLGKLRLKLGDDHSLLFGYTRFESQFGESMGSMLFQQEDGFRQVQLSDITTDTYTASYRWTPDNDWFDLRANIWAAKAGGTTRVVSSAPTNLIQWGYIPADEPRYTEAFNYGVNATNTSRIMTGFGDLRLDYGAEYTWENIDGDQYCSRIFTNSICVDLQPSKGKRQVGGVFSKAALDVTDWLTLDAGLRYDLYYFKDQNGEDPLLPDDFEYGAERDGGRLNPSVGVTLKPFDGLQLFARYAEGFRPPTLRETSVSDANAIGNPNLDPEVTKSWEVGANFLREGLLTDSDKARFKVAYFHNDHDNYISRVNVDPPVPGKYMFTFQNIDRAMFEGLELSGGWDLGFLFTNIAWTYYTNFAFCNPNCNETTEQSDYAVGHIPPETMLSLTLGMRFFDESLEVGARVTHAGARLIPISATNSVDQQRTPNWNPYTTVDAFASYEINDNLKVDFQAENVFDKYYVDAMDGWVPSPGRTLRANLTARF